MVAHEDIFVLDVLEYQENVSQLGLHLVACESLVNAGYYTRPLIINQSIKCQKRETLHVAFYHQAINQVPDKGDITRGLLSSSNQSSARKGRHYTRPFIIKQSIKCQKRETLHAAFYHQPINQVPEKGDITRDLLSSTNQSSARKGRHYTRPFIIKKSIKCQKRETLHATFYHQAINQVSEKGDITGGLLSSSNQSSVRKGRYYTRPFIIKQSLKCKKREILQAAFYHQAINQVSEKGDITGGRLSSSNQSSVRKGR